jgi:hypothetical protein
LLTIHHVQELMAHEAPALTEKRMEFIRGLGLIGYLSSNRDGSGVGSVLDLVAAEVSVAVGGAGCLAVRDAVRANAFRVGPGTGPIPDPMKFARQIAAESRIQSERDSAVAAIGSFQVIDPKTNFWEFTLREMRSPGGYKRALTTLEALLKNQILERGDKRAIAAAGTESKAFFDHLQTLRETLPNSTRALALACQLKRGIEENEIGPDATLEDLDILAEFYNDLRIAEIITGLSFQDLKHRIRREQLPQRVVRDALREFGQKRQKTPGSDLNDRYYAMLVPYCFAIFADKRTCEDFRLMRRGAPHLNGLIGHVERSGGDYTKIPERLGAIRDTRP